MRITLKMHEFVRLSDEIPYAAGPVCGYRIDNMPPGKIAFVINCGSAAR